MFKTVATSDQMGNIATASGASHKKREDWLTFPERQRYKARRAARHRTIQENTTGRSFIPALIDSKLKKPVKATLAVMHEYADADGHVSLSKTHLANLLGTSERTVQRHWAAAMEAGYLTKHDYPADTKRVSDMWLWAGDAPKDLFDWEQYPDEPMRPSTGPAPF